MKLMIHQPEHNCWLGFFHKMMRADYFVSLDNVQFEKNGFQNRNRFVDRRTGQAFWLTVPVITKNNSDILIRNIAIDQTKHWEKKYWGRLYDCYCRYPYFKQYAEQLEGIIYKCEYLRLVNLNYDLIEFVRRQLRIEVPLIKGGGLHQFGHKSELILNICKTMKADVYLSGQFGKNYLDEKVFEAAGIRIEYQQFEYPVYESKCYLPRLSAMDVLFNIGSENTRKLLCSKLQLVS
jgi:hypothetical protein